MLISMEGNKELECSTAKGTGSKLLLKSLCQKFFCALKTKTNSCHIVVCMVAEKSARGLQLMKETKEGNIKHKQRKERKNQEGRETERDG